MAESKSAGDVDAAVAEGGAYDVIRKRLEQQGGQLAERAAVLNQARLEEFGSSQMAVLGRARIRTENNCIARDIVQVGKHLLFGYNVFIGLKKETRVEDVFSLFSLQEGIQDLEQVPLTSSFLDDSSFKNDFEELYRYYKHTRLVQLRVIGGKLLAGFQIGERLDDLRVFRWAISADQSEISYIDNRGERDIQLPPSHDFEWQDCTREDAVSGRHPHINILDKVFVDSLGGQLTVKIEDNTEDGLGIYREPVEEANQSLDDAQFAYARVGSLVLIKVLPYKESNWRYLVFNPLTESVLRIDEIGESCVQLPEDHGIIFPGGMYLQSGEYKAFERDTPGLKIRRSIKSPNGEDVLYVFYAPAEGVVGLFSYNLIDKALQNPIYANGFALSEDGTLVVFSAETEATRVHPIQIWKTPYFSQEFASHTTPTDSFLGRIGNAELVRGISNVYSLCRLIDNQSPSVKMYEELRQSIARVKDAHYWLNADEAGQLESLLDEVGDTTNLVLDEFEKVQAIRKQSQKVLAEATDRQTELLGQIRPSDWQNAQQFISALAEVRQLKGHLLTIREYRYIDRDQIDQLESALVETEGRLNEQTVGFLAKENSLDSYAESLQLVEADVEKSRTAAELDTHLASIESLAENLDLVSELVGSLRTDDAVVKTRIVDAVSELYGKLNQQRASTTRARKNLGLEEATLQFGAQFRLFSQSIASALGLATSPDRCDEQMTRLLAQLEELESQFANYDQFLADIMEKREEIYESFESHKQQLLDEQARRAQNIADAADRMLSSIDKRADRFTDLDGLNAFFASDTLISKLRQLVEELNKLGDSVKADDIQSRLKAIKEQALRSQRDKADIYEEGGQVIRLGPRHRFSVNTQELDLTIIPRQGELTFHLSGTDYFEPVVDERLVALKDFWEMSFPSESEHVYRSEFLAYSILKAAEAGNELTNDKLSEAILVPGKLAQIVRQEAEARFREGYEKGIHDHDTARILKALVPALKTIDVLSFDPTCRGFAQVFWSAGDQLPVESWTQRARNARHLLTTFSSDHAQRLLIEEITSAMQWFLQSEPVLPARTFSASAVQRAAAYLVTELSQEPPLFASSKYARELVAEFERHISEEVRREFDASLKALEGRPADRWALASAWLGALVDGGDLQHLGRYIPEAVAHLICKSSVSRRSLEFDLDLTISGLLGDHPQIRDAALSVSIDEFLARLQQHADEVVPAYHEYHQLRQQILLEARRSMRLDEFKPRPLASFVRNRLINESYLPLIGDNLAKQMGTVGEDKRSDLMGLLMMISPPGYGKTTLMEYVASRLGLIFMKINCPSLGHDVLSLDPAQAPNATARQELHKLNLAFEMGNNVMLYLDDIQHTHPEFLQKFISLCDGTRRIEGVWKGETSTYDMRGKKFCVVMAGNPYTESGEAFKVPDMLANRADIYNLGDILSGTEEQFALSYIENALTSNQVLAPLAVREMDDVYKLIDQAKGKGDATTDLKHEYSGAEINEIVGIFQKLFVIQGVILRVNQQYIESAAQDDRYRIEPSFKLQGSYRNMNKLTEKVSAAMNHDELMALIDDHYLGESQLLTTGAESNLLKLAELRDVMTPEQAERWRQIKKDFLRNKSLGGDDSDVANKVVTQLADIVVELNELGKMSLQPTFEIPSAPAPVVELMPSAPVELEPMIKAIVALGESLRTSQPKVEVINQPVPGIDLLLRAIADTLENSIYPLVKTMDAKIEIDLGTHDKITKVFDQLKKLESLAKHQSGKASD